MESAKIKVVGVGGGGNNAVNRMIGSGLHVGFRLHFLGLGQNFDIPTLSLSLSLPYFGSDYVFEYFV
jgi:hypothetical protein